MTTGNFITLALIIGFGYMMFKGGGCCGSHGGHKKGHEGHEGHEEGKDEKPEIGPGENKVEQK